MITFRQFLDESINDKGLFKAIFIVGLPGAGKSYTLKKLSGAISPVVVNTDRAAEFLSLKHLTPINAKNWDAFFQDKSISITSEMLSHYMNGMLPMFVDGTSNNISRIIHRFGILESIGYDIGVVYVNTSLETALKRAKTRAREVDEDFIRSVYAQNAENVEFLKGKANFYREINNNDGELTNAVLDSAYKGVQAFFSGPVKNPIAKRNLTKLAEAKAKYLTPTIMPSVQLEHLITGWYK